MKAGTDLSLGQASWLMLTGMIIIGLIDNFVVTIGEFVGLWQFHLTRAAMALVILIGVARCFGVSLWPKRLLPVLLRSLLLGMAMLIYFGAIPLMPIAIVVACLFTAPVFVLVFSMLFFGQKIGWVRCVAVAIGFAGVILILQPDATMSPAMLLPVLAGALYAGNTIVARRYCSEEHTLAMLAGFFSVLGIFGAIGLLIFGGGLDAPFPLRGWIAPGWAPLGWIGVQAAGSIVAVGLLTRAYQGADPSYLSIFEYSLLIFASFWAYALYGETVGPWEMLGMALIAVAGSIIVLRGRAA